MRNCDHYIKARTPRVVPLFTLIYLRRRRRLGRRREIKTVSVHEAVHAQAAFYHHFKSPSLTQHNADTLPVQPNPEAPTVSGPFKLLPGCIVDAETSGLAHCPVCYDVLLPPTGNPQQPSHVITGSDVTRRRPVLAACGDGGRCLVTNSLGHVNSFDSVYSV